MDNKIKNIKTDETRSMHGDYKSFITILVTMCKEKGAEIAQSV
jgi:hypothetical protein